MKHTIADCWFTNTGKHPEANTAGGSWANRVSGRACAAKNWKQLPGKTLIDGSPWLSEHTSSGSEPHPNPNTAGQRNGKDRHHGSDRKSQKDRRKCDNLLSILPAHVLSETHFTVPVTLYINNHVLTVDALVDTGALQANYMDSDTAEQIKRILAKQPVAEQPSDSGANGDNVCDCKNKKQNFNNQFNPPLSNETKNFNKKLRKHTELFNKRFPNTANSLKGENIPSDNPPKNGEKFPSDKTKSEIKLKESKVCTGVTGMCSSCVGEVNLDLNT